MIKTKKTIDGVPVIITENDEYGDSIVELRGELADEADAKRLKFF